MKEKIKDLRLNVTVSAVISVIIGVLLLVFPDESLVTISRVIAAIIIIAGVSIVVSQLVEFNKNLLGVTVGGILLIIGIWIYRAPGAVVSIIPIAIGVILVVHGMQDLGMAFEVSKTKASRRWLPFVLAVLNILLGIICICRAFNVVEFAVRLIGVMLIFDGLADIGIVHKVRKATKVNVIDSEIISEEDI